MPPPESPLDPVSLRPIGIIHSPHQVPEETPIQPLYARGIRGHAEIRPDLAAGLRDLDGFSHVQLIYYLHLAGDGGLEVVPFLDDTPRGVFATCSPRRPNPIGLSVVRMIRIEGNLVHLEDLDVLDGTPLLDLKPYIPRFMQQESVRCGWLDQVDAETANRRGRRGYRESSEPDLAAPSTETVEAVDRQEPGHNKREREEGTR